LRRRNDSKGCKLGKNFAHFFVNCRGDFRGIKSDEGLSQWEFVLLTGWWCRADVCGSVVQGAGVRIV
jgi:hypothetical protein